ncbi:MAG TPA: hypothetical protein VK179_10900 [Bacteroidales bacterium]|nr:hypothetical protein [Bacteroidales bacterium]
MASTDITLLMWDTKENFNLEETQRNLGDEFVFKKKFSFNSKETFKSIWLALDDDEKFIFACHYKCADGSLYKSFQYSRIESEYNIPEIHYLSNDAEKASKNYQRTRKESERIVHYHSFMEKVTKNDIRIFTKKSIEIDILAVKKEVENSKYPKIKYAIITALYDDEFEQVRKIFDFPENEEINIGDKTYYVGYLKTNQLIQVVAGIPFNTGMVDASIMATQMIEIFKPEYILMSGVCGGFKEDCNLGDIVVARNVYTFQKGKLSDIKTKNEKGELGKVELFDKFNNLIDYDNLYDKDGNQISINIEKFKREDDSVISIDHFKDKYDKYKNKIIDNINKKIKDDFPIKLKADIKLHYEPMACSTMIIDKQGFFENNLKSIDRKTIAVEMESYGIARACRYANEGKTKPIIFKSVMDFTYDKMDATDQINWKKFAAFTSAQFMNNLFENNVI